MAGIYIHIPFCEQFCTYCNFYSVKSKWQRGRFIEALKREITSKKSGLLDIDFTEGASTIYFGGGTPSVLSIEELGEILQCVKEAFGVVAGSSTENSVCEISLEVNPNDITLEYAQGLIAVGFNRVSMGVQSFIDEHLVWMNRRHKADEAKQAFRYLREAGFKNISLDLISGYQMLTMEQWLYNIKEMVALAPEHISAYQMSVEPGSKLSGLLKKGEYVLPLDSVCQEQYMVLQQELKRGGYEQYEISNFSLPGYKSKHNSAYWDKTPYLGLGPAAHSFNGKLRVWNTESLKRYCDYYLVDEGNAAANRDSVKVQVCEREELSNRDVFNEDIMLGLRTVNGVNLTTLNNGFLGIIEPEIKRQLACGNLVQRGEGWIQIPESKFFVSDSIIRELFI